MKHSSYPRLFSEGKIAHLTIKNRAIMVPMATDFADRDGCASPQLIAYYEERAKGGVGLIITEYIGVDDVDSIPSLHNFRMAQDYHIKPAEVLTEAVHRHDALIFAQLHHGGATSKPMYTGRQSLSPSGIPMAPGAPEPREMTFEDIERVQRKFVDAAVRCKKAGFDGIELHGAHSYLIAQFFSKYYNRRTDAYGGEAVENRCRFVAEIIAGIREKLGNFPLSVRMCGDEMTKEAGFLTLEEGIEIATYLQSLGIDVINISNGSAWNSNANCDPYSYVPGWKKHVAKAYREALHIPVIATNTIKTPEFAEALLEEEISDFVGLGRSQFADSEFMNKAKKNRSDLIHQCIGCMVCRERVIQDALPARCTVNPRLGKEYLYPLDNLKENGAGQTVVVVGAGAAGLEAAKTLAKRKFRVVLFEKEAYLGGMLHVASLPPHKECLQTITNSRLIELQELGVEIRLGEMATTEIITALSPVGIFIATGATPKKLASMEGMERVVLAEDVITGKSAVTGCAVIIGAGLTGLECAEVVGNRGHKLTLVDRRKALGEGIFPVVFNDLFSRIKVHHPDIHNGYGLTKIQEGSIEITHRDTKEVIEVPADTIILAIGIEPNLELLEPLEELQIPVITLGDANQPGRIVDAIRMGFEKAWVFEVF